MNTEIPTRPEPFADSRETVAAAIAAACLQLSPDALGDVGAPSVETVRGALETVTTDRVPANIRAECPPRNHWRFRRSPVRAPLARADVSRVLLHRMQWHNGRGPLSLHGTFSDRFYVGAQTFETLDTIAAVYVHLFTLRGLSRSNSETWSRVLGNAGQRLFIIGNENASNGGTE